MNLPKGYVLLKKSEYEHEIYKAGKEEFKRGYDEGHEDGSDRIDELNKSLKRKNKEIANLRDDAKNFEEDARKDIKRLEQTIEVHEAERDDARAVVKQQILLEDKAAALDARKEALDAQSATLKDRESKLGSKEEGQYKNGYADGVADGVRKISEITQADRDNAMKIAMISASSHTPVANMKEAMDASKQLTQGGESTS